MFPPLARHHSLQGASTQRLSEDEYLQLLTLLAEKRPLSFPMDEALLAVYEETVSESLFTETRTTPPDCQTCGACCAYFHQIPVQIQDATPHRLTWQVYESNETDDPPLYWLQRDLENGNCLAFEGQVGDTARCLMYPLRPQACRAFEAGSDRCLSLRRLYGMESELSELEKQSHLQILKAHSNPDESPGKDETENSAPDENNTLAVLRELIDYNLRKLDEIVNEMERLAALDCEVTTLCEQSCQEIVDNQRAISDTLRPIAGSSEDSEKVFFEILQIGSFSQESLESAAKQLAQIGELVFENSGMKKLIEERA